MVFFKLFGCVIFEGYLSRSVAPVFLFFFGGGGGCPAKNDLPPKRVLFSLTTELPLFFVVVDFKGNPSRKPTMGSLNFHVFFAGPSKYTRLFYVLGARTYKRNLNT